MRTAPKRNSGGKKSTNNSCGLIINSLFSNRTNNAAINPKFSQTTGKQFARGRSCKQQTGSEIFAVRHIMLLEYNSRQCGLPVGEEESCNMACSTQILQFYENCYTSISCIQFIKFTVHFGIKAPVHYSVFWFHILKMH